MKMFRKEEGFTLVELMVVVLIIGILVAIAIPVFGAAKSNAQKKSCYANQRTIEGSANSYNAENGLFAADVQALVDAGYLKTSPKCPAPGGSNPYSFAAASTTTVNGCVLAAHGYYAP